MYFGTFIIIIRQLPGIPSHHSPLSPSVETFLSVGRIIIISISVTILVLIVGSIIVIVMVCKLWKRKRSYHVIATTSDSIHVNNEGNIHVLYTVEKAQCLQCCHEIGITIPVMSC